MINRQLTIINRLGLHARAANTFVRTARKFESNIKITAEGKSADGKSIMGVMTLGAAQGTAVDLTAEGSDEEAAMDALETLINNRFGEAE